MHKRNLLMLAALAVVAPASAHQHSGAIQPRDSGCPFEAAFAEAAAVETTSPAPTVVIIKATPAEAWLIDRPATFLP